MPKSSASFLLVVPFFLLLSGAGNSLRSNPPAAPEAAVESKPLPLNDNTAPPFKAVYRWGQGGCITGKYDSYGPWLNRTVIWAEDFIPIDSWGQIEGRDWLLGTWTPWLQKSAGRRFVLTVPMLVGGWSGKGPDSPPQAHVPVSLEQGAKGDYNIYYQHLAENLVKRGIADVTYLRLGHEFNGGWYTWRANTKEKAKAYAAYFRQIVTTMRQVPGGDKLKFIWNPAMESWWAYSPELAWPGDDVVDLVGIDVYDQSWMPKTYPLPDGASEEEIQARRQRAWDNQTNNEKASGLPFWVKFAARHGNKPLSLPEWGVCIRQDKHGGGDSAFFIQKMAEFISNPDNHVFFECYFDVSAGDGDHRLVPETDAHHPGEVYPTKLPLASARYQQLFSLPSLQVHAVPDDPEKATAPATP